MSIREEKGDSVHLGSKENPVSIQGEGKKSVSIRQWGRSVCPSREDWRSLQSIQGGGEEPLVHPGRKGGAFDRCARMSVFSHFKPIARKK